MISRERTSSFAFLFLPNRLPLDLLRVNGFVGVITSLVDDSSVPPLLDCESFCSEVGVFCCCCLLFLLEFNFDLDFDADPDIEEPDFFFSSFLGSCTFSKFNRSDDTHSSSLLLSENNTKLCILLTTLFIDMEGSSLEWWNGLQSMMVIRRGSKKKRKYDNM